MNQVQGDELQKFIDQTIATVQIIIPQIKEIPAESNHQKSSKSC